ncbi:MAG: hypothetical protein LUP95_01980 [Euryarchaeota archaeon]|nr:hypothetical protein [Euryarchaeota archaeon]
MAYIASAMGGATVMIWGMDLWVFAAFAISYISLIFSLIYGFWPRKDEDEDEEET